jgi:hypothetical protein
LKSDDRPRPFRENLFAMQRSTSLYFASPLAAILDCIDRQERVVRAAHRTIENAERAIKAAQELAKGTP